jgi:hypothetical protein
MSSNTSIKELDAEIYTDYKRPLDKPRPKFESVPPEEYPSKWYETIGHLFLILVLNILIFGFFVLMLLLRGAMTTDIFIRSGVGVMGSLIAISVVLMYFMGL